MNSKMLLSPSKVNDTLLAFARTGLGYDLITLGEHGHIVKLLQSAYDPAQTQQRIILILLPRASYKTTIASIAFPMWLLSRNPNLRVLIDSETYKLSKSILSACKQHYMSPTSPLAQTKFSFHKMKESHFERWSEDSIIVPTRTRPKGEGSIDAAGLDGVRAGMHYDIIIADDLHSQSNTRTQYQIDQVIEHYHLLMPILEKNGTLIFIGTRWAEEDAYTVIEKEASNILFIPATSTGPMNVSPQFYSPPKKGQTHLVYDQITQEPVECESFYLNFPNALPAKHLFALEKRMVYNYSAQYLLKPVSSRDKRFRDDWLKYSSVSPSDPDYSRYRVMGFVDPAFTTSEYSDFSGVVIVAVDEKRNAHVIFDSQEKLEPYSLIDRLFELSSIYSVKEWFVEEVAAQKVLLNFMDYLSAKQNRRLSISPVKSMGRRKEFRIQSLQPYFAAGKIFLHGVSIPDTIILGPDQESVLYKQIRKFPILKNDDVLDALAYLPQVLYDGYGVKAPQQPPKYGLTLADILKDNKPSEGGLRPASWANPAQHKCYIPLPEVKSDGVKG